MQRSESSTKPQALETQWLAFALPHEYIAALFRSGDPAALMCLQGLDTLTKNHVESCETQAGGKLLPVGLWADGVPCNWDRSETIETVSFNLPGLINESQAMRVPITGLSKRQVTADTWDDIFEIIAWSFGQMAVGLYPEKRHDGTAFTHTMDHKRKRLGGKSLGYKACLCEVRGDWDLFANVFHMPRWGMNSGCCWKCDIKPDQVREVGSDAAWRSPGHRMTHFQLMVRILQNGCTISSIFKIPWILSDIFRIDWLHCADLGCTADFLGNILLLCSTKLPGPSREERVKALWRRTVPFSQCLLRWR